MRRMRVMHMVDTLSMGGAERLAVQLANALPMEDFTVHFCTTRREGPLADLLDPHVQRLRLRRRTRVDPAAIAKLIGYVRRHRIEILHAHGTAAFLAVVASFIPPFPRVVWHIHFGRYAQFPWAPITMRVLAKRVSHAITVSRPLERWAKGPLGLPPARVTHVPNFTAPRRWSPGAGTLPGVPGDRILCLANIRAEKDHESLVRAMALVVARRPNAQLLLVGSIEDRPCVERVRRQVSALGLEDRVHFLGQREDVPELLGGVDVAVLSSAVEGLPLALLEYGMAGLPVVVTDVGHCADVVDRGRAGALVPAGDTGALGKALADLLEDSGERQRLGAALRERVSRHFSLESAVALVSAIYQSNTAGCTSPSRLAPGVA